MVFVTLLYFRKRVKMRGTPYFVSIIIVIYISASAPFLLPRTELKTIVVSQDNGTDNSTCWNETSVPCKTLDYALEHVTNSTFVLLRSGNYSYNLTEHFNFTNLREIGLVGDEESAFVTVECHHNGSLSFENSENITLRRVLLRGCGGLHNSTTGDAFKGHYHMPFLSAVFLLNCRDVLVDNCWIVQSPGIGLNMYDVGGDVQISHSWFESNRPIGNFSSSNIAVAGGGVYIEYTFKERTSDLNATLFAEFDSNSRYILHNCTFRDNNAPNQTFPTMIVDPHGYDHIPFGRGGGLSIFVKGVAKHNLIQITHCHFEDNHALWGGGLFIEFQDEVQNNTLEVKHCTFTNNSAHYAGGAIRSGTIAGSDSGQLLANQMRYEDCKLTSNSAVLGGGVSHHGTVSFLKMIDSRSLHIQFINCEWRDNTATMGSAIGLATPSPVNGLQDWTAKWPKFVHSIVVEDCNVTTNPIVLTEDKQVIGQGAIYSYSLPIIFKGVVNIEYNNNTAMVIENAVLHFFGYVTFRNNTGSQGGALGLYGTSLIMLMPHSNLNFFNNTAQQKGGAIYVKDSGPPVIAFSTTELDTRPCFIAYNNYRISLENISEWKAKIVFKGNQALSSGGGNSVYASTLQGCRQKGQPRINNKSLEWPNVFEYQDKNTSPGEQISTDPVLIRLNESDWEVSPSQRFDATVELIDEKNSFVLGLVNISITNRHVTLATASDLFLIQGDYPKINNLHLLGKKHHKFKVHASTVAGRVVQQVSKAVHLKDCYPGFEQHDNTDTCTCMEGRDAGISNCSADSKHVFLKRGYWGGIIGNKFSTYPCPPHYCNFPKHDSTFQYNAETICTDGRNGTSVLCGACKPGYSVNLGDEKCTKECLNSHLWLLLVFFIVTLLLVLVVLRIELDIFTTYLNAWLYSYQIITFLLQEGQFLDQFISFVIGVANLRVKGFGTCFYAGMTNLEKLGVNYILPSYVLLLLIVLAKLGRCRPACYINRNVSRAFCTLLVLCYTNITMISCNIIHYVPINGRWVLYADGNIEFVRDWKTHLPYTIIACLWFVLFVIFVPLVLLFTPWFLRRFQYLNNFRLFFDTFQKCFKDEYRWFAAYYFICRIYILFIALYVPFGPVKRSILEVSSVVIVVTCLYLRPYKTRPIMRNTNNETTNETDNRTANEDYNWLNTLDAILLTNLCFVVIFSSGIRSEASHSVQDGLEKTVSGLAYVPLVYLWCLVCYHGWKYFCPANLEGYQQVQPESGSTSESSRPAQPI